MYEQVFKRNGFSLRWTPTTISEEGVRLYGKKFPKKMLEHP